MEAQFSKMEAKYEMLESTLQKSNEGTELFKQRVDEQFNRLHDLIVNKLSRGEPDGSKQKVILGTPPEESSTDQHSQDQSNMHNKVIADPSLKTPKLTFPKFYGEDLKMWIMTNERFFMVHLVAFEQKVLAASIHFEKKKG
ncbi:hypothetical protein Ddye_016426 [Dipteronia dyeriana]|uniref:Uncharacterized protein n=1 Tax=Dipteronia dyeriana TaxID=168575 RepID=A0AAD9U6X5_9ROSI|nr:hypothetical protein Ddye_016426 [Dipteronia dyeriana]